jgi:hypothetical protein
VCQRRIPGIVQRQVCFEGGDQHAVEWQQQDHSNMNSGISKTSNRL